MVAGGGVRRWGMERWRLSCEWINMCKSTSMREEIPRDNQATVHHIGFQSQSDRLSVSDGPESCMEG